MKQLKKLFATDIIFFVMFSCFLVCIIAFVFISISSVASGIMQRILTGSALLVTALYLIAVVGTIRQLHDQMWEVYGLDVMNSEKGEENE